MNSKLISSAKFIEDIHLTQHGNISRLVQLSWGAKDTNVKLIYQKDGVGPKLVKLYLDRLLNPEALTLSQPLKNDTKVYCPDSQELIGTIYTASDGRKAIRLINNGDSVNIQELGIKYVTPRNKVLSGLIENLNLPGINSTNKFVFGISGTPGAGKTTLTTELQLLLTEIGYNVIVIKQDDFRIAKKERYNDDGTQKYPVLPFINQWHDWRDMLNLIKKIKASTGQQTFTYLTYNDGMKKTPKNYITRGFGDIVLVDGAFILNVGTDNLYGVAPDAIKNQLTASAFVFRGSARKIILKWIIEPIFQREKANNPEKSDDANHKRALYLAQLGVEDINASIPFWRQANIFFDNTNLEFPKFTIR